jgi:outer membrane protein assembly factor BamB
MNATSRLLRWMVVLSVAAGLLAGCGEEDQDALPAGTGSTAEATSERTDSSEATGTPTSSISPATATPPIASPEPAASPSNASPASTSTSGDATTDSPCPDDEFPAVGAMSITDGAVEWLVCSPEEAYRDVIGANSDIVLVEESGPIEADGSRTQHTIAFSAADGSELWRIPTGDVFIPAGPIDGQGIVVLANPAEGVLAGVDIVTGKEQWRVESSDGVLANSQSVAVVWDTTSQGSPSGFRGIDRTTGEELWVSAAQLSDQSGNFVGRSPAAVLDQIMAIPTGSTVSAIDMRTGATLWEASRLDDPVAAEGAIVGTHGSNAPPSQLTVTAIDAASGDELWTAPGSPSYGDLLAVGDGVVVVMDAGENRGLDLIAYELTSGNERWRVTQTSHLAQPQMIDGTSVVLLWGGELKVMSTTDGATIWAVTEPFGTEWMSNVGSNGESVFVAINSLPFTD